MAEYVDRRVVLENARIIFRNFAGKEGRYNQEGDRNFAVLLDEKKAEEMFEAGWNVKALKAREEGDPEQPYLQVSVSYKRRPPTIVMLTTRGRTTLPEDMIEIIDWADIKTIDLIVRPFEWAVNGKSGLKAYLQSFYFRINEDELQLKYADVPEIGAAPPHRELEVGPGYDFDGEVIEELPARAGRVDDSPPWR